MLQLMSSSLVEPVRQMASDELFKETISQADLPIQIGSIVKPTDPLYSVARGCLIAAEAAVS